MPVTEYERHQLFTWFEQHMGTERATTMMNLVPPVGWADVATRRDLEILESRFDAKFDAIDARFDILESRFEAQFDAIESRFDAKFDAIESRFDAELAGLRSELLRAFGTWLFASQAAVIAALSLVIALTR